MADLRREYGIDLLDFWRGRLSFYELCAYLFNLPSECASVRRMAGESESGDGWSKTHLLLGGLLDATRNQWTDAPVESCIPKALFGKSHEVSSNAKPAELQSVSELKGLFGSPESFIQKHGR